MTLTGAWRRAERRLPPGAFIYDLTRYHYDSDCGTNSLNDGWMASAGVQTVSMDREVRLVACGMGDTEVEALADLAANLKARR